PKEPSLAVSNKNGTSLASASNILNPILWSVSAYSVPMFPSPTIKNVFMKSSFSGECLPLLKIGFKKSFIKGKNTKASRYPDYYRGGMLLPKYNEQITSCFLQQFMCLRPPLPLPLHLLPNLPHRPR